MKKGGGQFAPEIRWSTSSGIRWSISPEFTINRLVISSDPHKNPVYGTFQPIQSNGGKVRKGEKSTIGVFWKNTLEQDEATGETKKKFLLKLYHIFNSERAEFDEQGTKKIAELQNLVAKKVNTEYLKAEAME